MSGILPDTETSDWKRRAKSMANTVGQKAISSKSIEVDSPEQLVVRDIQPHIDLNSGSENGWNDDTESNTTKEWQQDYSSGSATSDQYNEVYVIDSNDLAEDKVIGIYGMSYLHADVVTRQLRFNIGTAGNQGIKREFNLEHVENDQESRGLFLTDVVYGANENGQVETDVSAAEDGKRMVLHGYVAEPVGETISVASNPMRAGGSGGRASGR